MSYKIRIAAFEGPLDLLVYLIENAQMDIYDIQISVITNQYLEYLEDVKDADIEISTEFIVLAASLIEIKSKMLLPRTNIDGELQLGDDPRKDLVQRILEYKRTKLVAEALMKQEEYALNVYEKPQEDISEYIDNPDELLVVEMKSFTQAFMQFIYKKQKVETLTKGYTKIRRPEYTLENRMQFILDKVGKVVSSVKNKIGLRELVQVQEDNYDMALSFVSILQLIKNRKVKATQQTDFAEIYIESMNERS